ncbi:hypothetical protein F383_33485 [Gossypium arboreum]|uniref:Uncharacterized protein n=1 Tax=Gossypium arboreum TaxID=29729 RepID=A0A0B0PN22_GOSAR|nr:hypothetical protein F383_33485 [Gossypium arboreum]
MPQLSDLWLCHNYLFW